MTNASLEILPPTRLAMAYVPAHLRSALTLLLQMDMRFGDIVRTAREPMIAQIKMAWWREALTEAVDLRPKGEPLLQALAAVGGAPFRCPRLRRWCPHGRNCWAAMNGTKL